MSESKDLVAIAREYFAAIERGAPFEEIGRFLTEDCVPEELPNRLLPEGACCAFFFELRGERICRQRNCDGFEPFGSACSF